MSFIVIPQNVIGFPIAHFENIILDRIDGYLDGWFHLDIILIVIMIRMETDRSQPFQVC
jgi:hypothetical protein